MMKVNKPLSPYVCPLRQVVTSTLLKHVIIEGIKI